jgi:hypothetical protein
MYQNILSFGTCYKKRDRTLSKSSQSPKPLPCKAFSRRTKSLQTCSIFGDHQKSKRTCFKSSEYCIRRQNMFHLGRGSIRIPYLTCSMLPTFCPKIEHVSEYLILQEWNMLTACEYSSRRIFAYPNIRLTAIAAGSNCDRTSHSPLAHRFPVPGCWSVPGLWPGCWLELRSHPSPGSGSGSVAPAVAPGVVAGLLGRVELRSHPSPPAAGPAPVAGGDGRPSLALGSECSACDRTLLARLLAGPVRGIDRGW